MKEILETHHPDGAHWIHQVVDMVELSVDRAVTQLCGSPVKPPVMDGYKYTEPSKDPGHMAGKDIDRKWLV